MKAKTDWRIDTRYIKGYAEGRTDVAREIVERLRSGDAVELSTGVIERYVADWIERKYLPAPEEKG